MAANRTKYSNIGSTIVILIVRSYQKWVSPFLAPRCRFQPTCSQYAIEAISRFGLTKGGWLTIKRTLKCHPLHNGGCDPVPPKNRYRENTNDNPT